MMSAKLTTPGFLRIKIFQKKGYGVIILYYDATNKKLSHYLTYIADGVTWPKYGNSSISIREVIITSILYRLNQKNYFFEGCSWFKFNNLELALGMTLTFYSRVAKGLKLNVRKFCGLSPTFVEVKGEKLVGGTFFAPLPSWIGLKVTQPLLCFFAQYFCQFTSLHFHITPDKFACFRGGKPTPNCHPRKFLKVYIWTTKQSPPGYWRRLCQYLRDN